MKAIKKLLFCVALILATSCSDSPNDEMLTIINSDGSCRRGFSKDVSSTFMTEKQNENNPFPVEIDSNYSIVWQYKDGEIRNDFPISQQECDSLRGKDTMPMKKDFHIFIYQDYKSVEEMAEIFKLDTSHSWHNMNIQYHFEKKFRFFYTYFTYKETYPQIELPFDEPITDYMSENEANFWFTGKPNLVEGMSGMEIKQYLFKLKKKYEAWLNKNIWNIKYEMIVNLYDTIKNPPVPKEEFICLKDTVFELYNIKSKITDTTIDISEYLDEYFKTTVFLALPETNDSLIPKTELDVFEKEFSYQLLMPGEITQTNGVSKNDTLNWNLTAFHMVPGDYTIEAQSRKLNVWLLIITGILALTAIGFFVYKKKRK